MYGVKVCINGPKGISAAHTRCLRACLCACLCVHPVLQRRCRGEEGLSCPMGHQGLLGNFAGGKIVSPVCLPEACALPVPRAVHSACQVALRLRQQESTVLQVSWHNHAYWCPTAPSPLEQGCSPGSSVPKMRR